MIFSLKKTRSELDIGKQKMSEIAILWAKESQYISVNHSGELIYLL